RRTHSRGGGNGIEDRGAAGIDAVHTEAPPCASAGGNPGRSERAGVGGGTQAERRPIEPGKCKLRCEPQLQATADALHCGDTLSPVAWKREPDSDNERYSFSRKRYRNSAGCFEEMAQHAALARRACIRRSSGEMVSPCARTEKMTVM